MNDKMLKEIIKLYSISEKRAKELIKEEKEKFGNLISDLQAMIYIINRKKRFT